jgi:hypothetical protein
MRSTAESRGLGEQRPTLVRAAADGDHAVAPAQEAQSQALPDAVRAAGDHVGAHHVPLKSTIDDKNVAEGAK